jgi:hypothetical protein
MALRIGNVRTVVVLEIQRALVHVAIDDAQSIPPKISLGDRENSVARAIRLFRTLRVPRPFRYAVVPVGLWVTIFVRCVTIHFERVANL